MGSAHNPTPRPLQLNVLLDSVADSFQVADIQVTKLRAMRATQSVLHDYVDPKCLLCGEEGLLTREHKFKQSVLARKFGRQKLYVGSKEDFAAGTAKLAQSTGSKHLKFVSPICEACNTKKTQPGDRQFDALLLGLDEAYERGADPTAVFASERFAVGSVGRLDLLRHFAKIMCNFLADTSCPIPARLSTFAIHRSDRICLNIGIGENSDYKQQSTVAGDHPFAQHQGLSISGKEDLEPEYARCATSFGSLDIYYWLYFTSEEKSELKERYPDAHSKITDKIRADKEYKDLASSN